MMLMRVYIILALPIAECLLQTSIIFTIDFRAGGGQFFLSLSDSIGETYYIYWFLFAMHYIVLHALEVWLWKNKTQAWFYLAARKLIAIYQRYL